MRFLYLSPLQLFYSKDCTRTTWATKHKMKISNYTVIYPIWLHFPLQPYHFLRRTHTHADARAQTHARTHAQTANNFLYRPSIHLLGHFATFPTLLCLGIELCNEELSNKRDENMKLLRKRSSASFSTQCRWILDTYINFGLATLRIRIMFCRILEYLGHGIWYFTCLGV